MLGRCHDLVEKVCGVGGRSAARQYRGMWRGSVTTLAHGPVCGGEDGPDRGHSRCAALTGTQGAYDQHAVEQRPDVLVYSISAAGQRH
jgi:hypothetical protein